MNDQFKLRQKECKIVSESFIRRITIDYYNYNTEIRNNIYKELDELFGMTGYRVVRSGPIHGSINSGRMIIEIIVKEIK